QWLTHRAEEDSVGVDRVGAEKDLQVAEHVSDDEGDEHGAADRHDDLLADHGAPQRDHGIGRPYGGGGSGSSRRRVSRRGSGDVHGSGLQFDITVLITSASPATNVPTGPARSGMRRPKLGKRTRTD